MPRDEWVRGILGLVLGLVIALVAYRGWLIIGATPIYPAPTYFVALARAEQLASFYGYSLVSLVLTSGVFLTIKDKWTPVRIGVMLGIVVPPILFGFWMALVSLLEDIRL